MGARRRRRRRRGGCLPLVFLAVLAALAFANKDRIWQYLYPVTYYQDIALLCRETGEELPLVLAVIKAESNFREDAVSPQGAVGLMQVMPETGRWMAERLELADYSSDKLRTPAWNLRLGIAYLNYLRREFPDSVPQALAAYNAGPTRLRSWLAAGDWDGSDGDIDSIPYRETREYVKKVLRYYEAYGKAY